MTNRLILDDPQMADSGTGYQRQLAEHTWPGAEFRVLLADQTFTSATGLTLTDVNNLTLSLTANVRYYYEWSGLYQRAGSDGVQTTLARTGVNAPTTGDRGNLLYYGAGGTDTWSSGTDPFGTRNLGSNGSNDIWFIFRGLFSCTTAGTVTAQFAQRTSADANSVTLYAGSRLIFQPIYNLAYESNP